MTKFEEIYELFLNTEINSQSLAEMDSYSLSKYLKSLIFMARAQLYTSIYSNPDTTLNIMEDITEFETFNYKFKYETSPQFTLDPIPSKEHILQVLLNNIELEYNIDYTYDNITGVLEIIKKDENDDSILKLGDTISIIAFKNPVFNQNLNILEIGLLVSWMGVVFLRDKLKDQKVYNFTVYGKEDKVYAQAPFMTALKSALAEAEKLAEQKTIKYTYRLHPEKLRPIAVKGTPFILGRWKR